MAHSTLTMRDIATALGVSVATVSRALKDSPRISEEQREKIKTYAKEHNYYPNVMAEACAATYCALLRSLASLYLSLNISISLRS